MGITLLSCLEIFSNPDDLVFSISNKENKWGFIISRGSGHGYKPLITTKFFAESKENALGEIKKLLTLIMTTCIKTLETDPANPISDMLNPDMQKIDLSKNLNEELIQKICDTFLHSSFVETQRLTTTTVSDQ